MNNLLDLFETVTISNKNVISEDDRRICEMQFEFYTKIYNSYEKHLKCMIKLEEEQKAQQSKTIETLGYYHSYIYSYSGVSVSVTKKEMFELTINFISVICDYFNKKYNITTNSDILNLDKNKAEPKYCTLDEVLNKCILGSLDGLSFKERAVQEIRTKARTKRHYRECQKEWNYDIKGKTIKFRFRIENILPALWFYDNGENEIINYYTHNKIDDCRKFENGNTDIKFYKSEYAFEFARKYLGYVA